MKYKSFLSICCGIVLSYSCSFNSTEQATSEIDPYDCILKAEALHNELLGFKDESKFQLYGFGPKGYENWLERVKSISTCDESLLQELKVVSKDLETLGFSYLHNGGKEDDYSMYINGLFTKEDDKVKGSIDSDINFPDGDVYTGKWKIYLRQLPSDFITVEIINKDGKYFEIKDGKKRTELLKYGEKLVLKGNTYGEYYMIQSGELIMFDSEGNLEDAGWQTEIFK